MGEFCSEGVRSQRKLGVPIGPQGEVKKEVGSSEPSQEREGKEEKDRKNNLASQEGVSNEEFDFSR